MVPSHPTIVIGYGPYGLAVLRTLLQDAYDRGALEWEEPEAGEDPGARHLKNLALLWAAGSGLEDSGFEGDLARDLYSQIQDVDDSERPASGLSLLAAAAVAAKDRLLDASRRGGEPGRMRLGLDVIVLAQPTGAQVLGSIEDLMEPVMDALAADRSLEPPGSGDHLLNFTMFLDFDRFWDGGVQSERLRSEVQSSTERWRKREAEGKPGFAHIYLMDGQVKEGGRRKEKLRIEEITLLLGFMLFEGQRDHASLRYLFQRRQEASGSLATFSMRMIERSREMLARLAAAHFAAGWLDYMASDAPAVNGGRDRLREAMVAYGPTSLELSEERRALEETVEQMLLRIDEGLRDLPEHADQPDWPERVRTQIGRSVLELKAEMSAWAGERSGQLTRELLSPFPDRLKSAVRDALHHPTRPLPLGAVISEIRGFDRHVEEAVSPAVAARSTAAEQDSIDAAHREYQDFVSGQLKPANMELWWLLFALILAAVWTPVAVSAVNEMTPPDPSDWFILRKACELLVWIVKPWMTVLLLSAVFWATGRFWFGRNIKKLVARGRAVYTSPNQGKLQDVVRRSLRTGSGARSIETYMAQVFEGMRQRLRSEVRRETARVLDRLQARKREVEWLRGEMREFLRTHGVDPDQRLPALNLARAPKDGYRVFVDWERDLQVIARRNPPTPERFQSAQSEKNAFDLWDGHYCDTFLYPVVFLEHLSRDYREVAGDLMSGQEVEAVRVEMAREIRRFLEEFGQFPLAFDWSSAPGVVAETQSFCVLPRVWKDLPGISMTLGNYEYTDSRVIEGRHSDRCYLLRVQWNVSLGRLGPRGDDLYAETRL